MILDNDLMMKTSIASFIIIFSITIRNTIDNIIESTHERSTQNKKLDMSKIGKLSCTFLFIIGWMIFAYIISLDRKNKELYIAPCIGVVLSIIISNNYINNNNKQSIIIPVILYLSWCMIGLMVGNHYDGNYKYIGLISTLLVYVSNELILPYEHRNDIDGPGMLLYVIAWGIIIIINSNR